MPTEQPPKPRPGAGTPYRTPRYPVFLLSGAALGLALGVGLALYGGGGPSVTGPAGVLGYFAAFGVILGALAGGTLAVLVESLLNRRLRQERRRR